MKLIELIALLNGEVEYTGSTFTDWIDLTNESSGYDTKPMDGKAPVLELWG